MCGRVVGTPARDDEAEVAAIKLSLQAKASHRLEPKLHGDPSIRSREEVPVLEYSHT